MHLQCLWCANRRLVFDGANNLHPFFPPTQADASRLATLYTSMAADAVGQGLDAAAVAATAPYYEIDRASSTPLPLSYTAFTPPLAPAAVRLLVFFLEGSPGADALHAACDAAMTAAKASLPRGAIVHASALRGRHMTVFQTSHPQALCPTPLVTNADGSARAAAPPPGPPPPGAVDAEIEAARALAAAHAPPTLVGHSIALARSGALLLLLTEAGGDGRVAALRAAAATTFPGCGVRQPAIMHVTLGRVLTPLTAADVLAVANAVAPASAAAAGVECTPRAVSHVCEETFATVAGPRVDCVWGGG